MKTIEEFEKARKTGKELRELGINGTMYWAYITTKKTGNTTIDFNEVIWDKDIEPIVNTCRQYDVKYITISCGMSSLVQTLSMFQNLGCQIGGITQVKAPYKNIDTDEFAIIPAIIVRM